MLNLGMGINAELKVKRQVGRKTKAEAMLRAASGEVCATTVWQLAVWLCVRVGVEC